MVLNRLTFIENNPTNEQLISYFIFEVMAQLNVCFKKDDTDLGDETKYSTVQKSIIADLVSIYILIMQAGAVAGGVAGSSAATTTFISKAKAGSVEVEYKQFDVKLGGSFAMASTDLITFYKKNAINKALSLGCIIDICDDCSVKAQLQMQNNLQGFITFQSDDGCGCCGG